MASVAFHHNNQLKDGDTVKLFGEYDSYEPGEQTRDFVYVKDVARANVMAAISNAEPEAYGQVYNVGTGTNLSVNQIASFISEDVIYLPPRTGEARNSLANIEKIYKTFGWRPQVTVDEWIEEQMNG